MTIDKNLYTEINEYCKENNIKTRDFIHRILNEAFLKEKYGESPFAFIKKEEKHVEKEEQPIVTVEETIKEHVIEIPVIEEVVETKENIIVGTEKVSEEPIIVKKKRKLK